MTVQQIKDQLELINNGVLGRVFTYINSKGDIVSTCGTRNSVLVGRFADEFFVPEDDDVNHITFVDLNLNKVITIHALAFVKFVD